MRLACNCTLQGAHLQSFPDNQAIWGCRGHHFGFCGTPAVEPCPAAGSALAADGPSSCCMASSLLTACSGQQRLGLKSCGLGGATVVAHLQASSAHALTGGPSGGSWRLLVPLCASPQRTEPATARRLLNTQKQRGGRTRGRVKRVAGVPNQVLLLRLAHVPRTALGALCKARALLAGVHMVPGKRRVPTMPAAPCARPARPPATCVVALQQALWINCSCAADAYWRGRQ
jgi:hypothetical protein